MNCGLLYTTGYPVAWCISNQETTEVVTLRFQTMKQQFPDTQIRILIQMMVSEMTRLKHE